eukprot:9956444-Prorocentrum_lima.AAC.1
MTSSLVGSEMCIRDSPFWGRKEWGMRRETGVRGRRRRWSWNWKAWWRSCLLYTSDAADDM